MVRREKDAATQAISSWESIVHTLNKQNPTKLDPSAKRFVEYAWDRFDARHVLDILLSEEPSYSGHKDVLFAGFCAWAVASPARLDIVRSAMALRVIEIIRLAEDEVPKELHGYPVLVDFYVRLIRIGADFFQDIYYPLGGLGKLITSPSRAGLRRALQKRLNGVRSVVTIMQITHYCIAELMKTGSYRPPSFNAAFTIISNLSKAEKEAKRASGEKKEPKQYLRGRSLINYRDYYESQLCLLYAASSIQVNTDQYLLDHILTGAVTWETHGHLLPEWIARAHFANNTILAEIAEEAMVRMNASYLPSMADRPIPDPSLSKAMGIETRHRYKIA